MLLIYRSAASPYSPLAVSNYACIFVSRQCLRQHTGMGIFRRSPIYDKIEIIRKQFFSEIFYFVPAIH